MKRLVVILAGMAVAGLSACDDGGITPDGDNDADVCVDGPADRWDNPCPAVDGDADADDESDETVCPTVFVATEPSGAVVFVDGVSTDAVTPATLPLPQGQEVVVSFALNDYDESPATFFVTEDCTPPTAPFVLYPSVELENGTLWRNNSVTGTEGEYPVAFLLQEGPELTGDVGGNPLEGEISPEGEFVLYLTENEFHGHSVSPSLLEGTWFNNRGDSGDWTITW